jgi:hypothetical protein
MMMFVSLKYSTSLWSPCTAHCMDLLLEDIGKLDYMSELVKPAVMLIRFINNHSSSLAIFRRLGAAPSRCLCLYQSYNACL